MAVRSRALSSILLFAFSAFIDFDKVQLGLSADQIKELLGEPSRKYTKEIDPKATYWSYKSVTIKLDENKKVIAKSVDPTDSDITLAALEKRYNLNDLELVKTVVGCRKVEEKLGSDVYFSKELGAQIAVSFTGDIQRVVQNEEFKRKPAEVRDRPVCQSAQ